MSDLAFRYLVLLTFKTIRSNPDKHLKDIFGDTQLGPNAAIYGNTAKQAAEWIKKTNVPVVLGYDLTDMQLPAVTIHLSASNPDMPFIGDVGIGDEQELDFQEKEVLVESFQPSGLEPVLDDNGVLTAYKLSLPEDMPFEQKELFLVGLKLRDADNREFFISADDDGNTLIMQADEKWPLSTLNTTGLEVVSPVLKARYSRGHMQFNETITIVIHGMSNRQEGLWIFYMVMWGLLKFRPVLTATFGLDLSMPSASDYSKDQSMSGENVWTRYITVNAKTSWTWENDRKADIIGLLLTVSEGRKD